VNFEKANALKTTLKNNALLDKALVSIGKERGLTSLYIGSDGKEFSAPLLKQRKTLDTTLESLKKELVTTGTIYFPELLKLLKEENQLNKNSYKALLASYAKLPEIRKNADSGNSDFKNIFFDDYTAKIATPTLSNLLGVKNYALDTEISSLIATLIQLYTAKENSALE